MDSFVGGPLTAWTASCPGLIPAQIDWDSVGKSPKGNTRSAPVASGAWGSVPAEKSGGTLPEAHTDFIYPVIGEELGLLGTLIVLALFSLLAFAVFRLSRNTDDSFVRYAAAGVGAWIVVQAVVNIGGVLGLLPVAGVTLPLVSYGGSSLIPTLTAIGMLMAFARQEPGARRALRRRSTATGALRRR